LTPGSHVREARAILAAMRTTAVRVVLVGLAVVVAVACADKKTRLNTAEDFSAAHLGAPSPSLLRYLSPEEKDALMRVGDDVDEPETAGLHPGDEGYGEDDGLGVDDNGGQETLSEKTAKASVSLLGVGLTLGALAAPFLLF
jgi:hypothetical protein